MGMFQKVLKHFLMVFMSLLQDPQSFHLFIVTADNDHKHSQMFNYRSAFLRRGEKKQKQESTRPTESSSNTCVFHCSSQVLWLVRNIRKATTESECFFLCKKN